MKIKNKKENKKKHLYKNQKDNIERVLNENTDFDTIETYKSMRTNIMFSIPKSENGKIIVITSSSPGEGKTTTSINLAITFAQMGARVLLIDCDLRKPRIHRYLELGHKDGLTNVLCGFSEFEKAVKVGVRENLDCLTSGEIPPNPTELLENEGFEKLLAKLKAEYDYIFIDTPPMTVVTDSSIVMKRSMGTVVVIRQNITSYDMLDSTMEAIGKTGIKVLGVVVLGTEEKTKKYGYYKKRRYGYKYGYKYGYRYKYDYKYGDDVSEKK